MTTTGKRALHGASTTKLTPKKPATSGRNVSHAVVELLQSVGVQTVYGIIGGAIAPFAHVLGASPLRFVAMRHEAGAAFAACEASLAARRPTAIMTTTGPGLTNALTGVLGARSEGAHVVLISASTTPQKRGRFAVQETSDRGLIGPQALSAAFDLTMTLESSEQLGDLARQLATGFARPQGFVAHVSLPLSIQHAPFDAPAPHVHPVRLDRLPSPAILDDVVQALSEPFVIWAGYGARHADQELLELAEFARAPVIVTPRAKGVFPETHPLFLGVTGIGGHDVAGRLHGLGIERALVLGTRLGEFSTVWDPALIPPSGLVHVDIDPQVIGAAYPSAPTLPVVADVAQFLRALLQWLPSRGAARPALPPPELPPLTPPVKGRVRPAVLMNAVQRMIVDASDALVFAEPGNSFAWANHLLRFPTPRYRLSGYWASMGHMITGAVGAALETNKTCVVISGDGAMLMLSELSTAAEHHAPVVWIVLNDARYGMTEDGMRAQGFNPTGTSFPRCDFAAIARAMGCDGISVDDEGYLDFAMETAMHLRRPFVVDVSIDPVARAPFLQRIKALSAMGASS